MTNDRGAGCRKSGALGGGTGGEETKSLRQISPELFFGHENPLDANRHSLRMVGQRHVMHRRDAEYRERRIPSRTGATLGWQASDQNNPGFCFAIGR